MTHINFDFKNITKDVLYGYKDDIMKEYKSAFDNIADLLKNNKKSNNDLTFENIFEKIIDINTKLEPKISIFHYVTQLYPNKELRDVGAELKTPVNKFIIDQTQRQDVYKVCDKYYKEQYAKDLENDELDDEQIRYVTKCMRDFKRNGFNLGDDELTEVTRIKQKIEELGNEFTKNVNEENTFFMFTKEELDGIPEPWFNGKNVEDGKYKCTLTYPDFVPGIKYIKDERVRKTIYDAFASRGVKEGNVAIFEQIVQLRHQLATKLGYKTFADYATEVKLIKSGKNAIEFEKKLNDLFTPLYESDMKKMLDFAKSYEPCKLQKTKLDKWDEMFYSRAYTESFCDLDLEKVSEYFPLEKVTEGLFKIYQKVLGLTFTYIDTDNKWHDDVKLYSVEDTKSGELLGYFFLDMYPRDGKYGHACASPFISGYTDGEGELVRPNVLTMICNFPQNSCISHRDVVTFFHEFGHVMHQICSKPKYPDFCSFNVEWDFIECPSQSLEYFCYAKDSLKLMSSHKETGKSIPDDMIDKLIKMKNVLGGHQNKTQLIYGTFDLQAHTQIFDNKNNNKFDSRKLWYQVEKSITGYNKEYNPDNFGKVGAFTHLIGSYAAGYYGYLFSKVYAANIFYKLFKDDVLNATAGMRYRRFLERGSTEDSIDLLKELLGEEPNEKYFLIDLGLE